MSTRGIIRHTNHALRQVSEPVGETYPLRQLVAEMFRAMRYPSGIGLAAPQLGELVRVVVVCVPHGHATIQYAVVNPEIYWTEKSRPVQDWEGCLSFPTGFRAMVPRSRRIKIRGLDQDRVPIQFGASALVSRCLQHEIDHLNGVLITDTAIRTDTRKQKSDNSGR